ncbi:MAG TPA: glycosyltransferase [Coleofasciculaceae cyanobacterium]|jgi:glycosyltransferase involved in cell wall biosynthesis
MSKISIIIPTYNSKKTIEETITSLQQQSFSDYEIIVIDDGSQDNTIAVVKNIAEPRLKLFSYENGGVATARNRGISHATGEFIAFLDADDLWSPDKLALQIEALYQNPEAKVVYSWTQYIDEQGKPLFSGTRYSYRGDVYQQLLQTNFLTNASNILVHRDVLDLVPGFNPKLAYTADWDFYLRLAKNFNFAVVPKFQIYYRQSANSMSTKVEQLKEESLLLLDRVYQTATTDLKLQKNQSYSILYLYCADLYRKKISINNRESLVSAKQNLKSSILLYPPSLLQINTQRLLIKLILSELYFIAPVKFLSKL